MLSKKKESKKNNEVGNSTPSPVNRKNAPPNKETIENTQEVSLMLFASWVKNYKGSIPKK